MIKKSVALVTLASFLVFSWSCVIHKVSKLTPDAIRGKDVKCVRVQKTSGERIDFPKERLARIVGERIVVMKPGYEGKKIRLQQVYSVNGQPQEIETRDGKKYNADQIIKFGKDYFIVGADVFAFSAPLGDIEFVWIRKVNLLATLLLDVGIPAGLFALAAASMSGFNMSMGSWSGSWFGSF